jgi:hypothetical protein
VLPPKPKRCKCHTLGNARRWQPLSILQFTRTFRMQHFSYCPKFRSSEQSLDVTMQLIPSSWLPSRTIDFSTQVRNWSAKRNFSISLIVIGTSRLVDSKTSPGFCALFKFREKTLATSVHKVAFSRLQDTLQRLFDQGRLRLWTLTVTGFTLLTVS